MSAMVVMGRIRAPYGIKGWVKVQPYADDPLDWGEMAQWWLAEDENAPAEAWRPVALRGCRAHGNEMIAAFEQTTERNAAQALRGLYIGAPREVLPEVAEGEYYWADLTGLSVRNLQGEALGVVVGLISTGAHDVLRVRDDEADVERLIPFVDAYVPQVDVAAGWIAADWQKDW